MVRLLREEPFFCGFPYLDITFCIMVPFGNPCLTTEFDIFVLQFKLKLPCLIFHHPHSPLCMFKRPLPAPFLTSRIYFVF